MQSKSCIDNQYLLRLLLGLREMNFLEFFVDLTFDLVIHLF